MDRVWGEMDDESLAIEARNNREARNALFMRHRGMLMRMGSRAKRVLRGVAAGGGPITSEDIDQEAFVAFCDLLDAWEPGRAPFTAYLAVKMPWRLGHYARKALHYRSRTIAVLSPAPDGAKDEGPVSEGAERDIVEAEDETAWAEHTGILDEDWKRLVTLRFREGLSSAEIAAVDGRTKRTVNRELHAALSAIRAHIEDEWEGCG